MSLLDQGTSGVTLEATVTVIHGEAGVGKSTFAAQYPEPFFADIEDGTKGINLKKRLGSKEIPDYETLVAFLNELASQNKFKTGVVDSLTKLEEYVERVVCKENGGVATIKDIPWGNGPVFVRKKFSEFMALCRSVADKGVNVVIIAHTNIKPYTDPHLNATYDRNVLQCNDKELAKLITSAADNVYFIKNEVETKTEKNAKRAKAFGDGSKTVYTDWRPAFEAKNRHTLPFEMPPDFSKFMEAIETAKPQPVEELKKQINELLKKAPEETQTVVKNALVAAGDDQVKLIRIKARLTTVVTS